MASEHFEFSEPSHVQVERLAHIEEHAGENVDSQIAEFGRLLAGRLHDDVFPMGFVLGCELMLYDLQKGVSGFGEGPIDSPLIKRTPLFYQALRDRVPALAKVAFSDEFATEVQTVMSETLGREYDMVDLTEQLDVEQLDREVFVAGEMADGTVTYSDGECERLSDDYDLSSYRGYMSSVYGEVSVEVVASPLVAVGSANNRLFGVDKEGYLRILEHLNKGVFLAYADPDNLPDHRRVEHEGKTLYFPTEALLDAFWVTRKGGITVSPEAKLLTAMLGHHPEMYEEKTENDGTLPEVELSGLDPFDLMKRDGKLPDEGILLKTKISRGGNAVFDVYDYDSDSIEKISFDEQGENGEHQYLRPNFRWGEDSKAQQLTFAYEQPDYFDRDTQPFNRSGETTYIGHSFDRLDAIDLTNNGRLLILKSAWPLGNSHTRLEQVPWRVGLVGGATRKDVRWFPKGDYIRLGETVEAITRDLIGMSAEDAQAISQNVQTRLEKGPSPL